MGRVALVGVGIYMIGDGIRNWPNIGGALMIAGGVVFLLAALGVNF